MSERLFVALGALAGMTGVAAGAFGAHALKARLSAEMLAIFETGARYQMYHALALIAAGWLAGRVGGALPTAAGCCFIGGIFVFSGSLYLLGLSGVGTWGAVTPIGGVLFMAGWLLMAIAALRMR